MKKIGILILTTLLIPVLKEILIEFSKLIMKFCLDLLKQYMVKWKNTEEKNAKSEEEKVGISKKWEERMEDLEQMKSRVDSNVDKIINEALKNSSTRMKEIEVSIDEPKKIS